MHQKEIIRAGKDLNEAEKVLIMLHGRGATAEDILSIAPYLQVKDFALLAPQATNYTWYPHSFLMPPAQNEPWLTSALNLIDEIVSDLKNAGFSDADIFFSGFSQGACLTLEYVARHARKWGGIAAFSGGLIGDKIYLQNYSGDFNQTPVFIGSSNPDPHIPVDRVQASNDILKKMNAGIVTKIYPNLGHTVSMDEIEEANKFVFAKPLPV
jgi:phospholipase/carboxylesterase